MYITTRNRVNNVSWNDCAFCVRRPIILNVAKSCNRTERDVMIYPKPFKPFTLTRPKPLKHPNPKPCP